MSKRTELQGVVQDCKFFGEGNIRVRFNLRTGGLHREYFVLGLSNPPIENGRYVEGWTSRQGNLDVVDSLVVWSSRGGMKLGSYVSGSTRD